MTLDLNERIGGYAPGGYHCKCLTCEEFFDGDKRAIACKICALLFLVTDIHRRCSDPEHPEEIPEEIVALIEGSTWSP